MDVRQRYLQMLLEHTIIGYLYHKETLYVNMIVSIMLSPVMFTEINNEPIYT